MLATKRKDLQTHISIPALLNRGSRPQNATHRQSISAILNHVKTSVTSINITQNKQCSSPEAIHDSYGKRLNYC